MQKWVQSLSRKDPLEEGNGNPLQYASPGNPMDRGAWWVTVQRVTSERQQQQQKKPQITAGQFSS